MNAKFQCLLFVLKRSYICYYKICMTVPLNVAKYMMRWAIWYHLYNLKNEKNTHGGVLLLVFVQLIFECR